MSEIHATYNAAWDVLQWALVAGIVAGAVYVLAWHLTEGGQS